MLATDIKNPNDVEKFIRQEFNKLITPFKNDINALRTQVSELSEEVAALREKQLPAEV